VPAPALRLDFSAISDVGRVRRDNQDSGYAGPWLLAVCDGVGGAARGDIASSTAIGEIRTLDTPPPVDETTDVLLSRVAEGLEQAHVRLGRVVDAEPALNGTSTTATVALFDGSRLGFGHVGDSRAYLFRHGELSQLTRDHTFVQSLIDEGRITEDEARVHPHKNMILKALDGFSEVEPDLFVIELVPGDRVLLCSDGASGVLTDGRLADILDSGNADYAAVELVRASLEAGSTDNVTCIVADVRDSSVEEDPEAASAGGVPLIVGAAAEQRRRPGRPAKGGTLFRGHRAGDTGELEVVDAELPPRDAPPSTAIRNDPGPEDVRYAPRAPARRPWLRRVLALVVVAGLVWIGLAWAWSWSQQQYYVGEQDGSVVVFRGVDASLPGVSLSHAYLTTNVELERLSDFDAESVREGVDVDSLAAARRTVENLADKMSAPTTVTPSASPTTTPTTTPTSTATPTGEATP
jgi:protein phosphatase